MNKDTQPQEVNDFHLHDDVDVDEFAHHHTLGFQEGQAAPGNLVQRLVKRVQTLEEAPGGGDGGSPNSYAMHQRAAYAYTSQSPDVNNSKGDTYSTPLKFEAFYNALNYASSFNYEEIDGVGVWSVAKDGIYTVQCTVYFYYLAGDETITLDLYRGTGLSDATIWPMLTGAEVSRHGSEGGEFFYGNVTIELNSSDVYLLAGTQYFFNVQFASTGAARTDPPNKPYVFFALASAVRTYEVTITEPVDD